MTNLPLVVDACVLINLHASDQLASILQCFSTPPVIPQIVVDQELLQCYTGPVSDSRSISVPIDLDRYESGGLLTLSILNDAEEEAYVSLVVSGLGDGEAATYAIAMKRALVVATDDRRAVKIIQLYSPTVQIVQTPEIMHHWATTQSVPTPVLREALLRIGTYGCYHPPRLHPLYDWWVEALGA